MVILFVVFTVLLLALIPVFPLYTRFSRLNKELDWLLWFFLLNVVFPFSSCGFVPVTFGIFSGSPMFDLDYQVFDLVRGLFHSWHLVSRTYGDLCSWMSGALSVLGVRCTGRESSRTTTWRYFRVPCYSNNLLCAWNSSLVLVMFPTKLRTEWFSFS